MDDGDPAKGGGEGADEGGEGAAEVDDGSFEGGLEVDGEAVGCKWIDRILSTGTTLDHMHVDFTCHQSIQYIKWQSIACTYVLLVEISRNRDFPPLVITQVIKYMEN